MRHIFTVALLCLSITVTLTAQEKSNPCSSPGSTQFDFWLGKWTVEWKDKDGKNLKGTNVVQKILDGCVLLENFDAGKELKLRGKSFSMYNPNSKTWRQTWVDNNGSFLTFNGEFTDGKMYLGREFKSSSGKTIYQRMIFYDIEPNSFKWDWQASDNLGKSWKLLWRLNYKRQ